MAGIQLLTSAKFNVFRRFAASFCLPGYGLEYMSTPSTQWDAKDWERYVDCLLTTHHSLKGEMYQAVPDIGGDGGLEGCSNTGHAYQSYADQDTKNHKERTRKQKDKIRDDLKKLLTYKDFWAKFFKGKKIRFWTLVVPQLDEKDVVLYAREMAEEVRSWDLPFIANDFEAFVSTADGFPQAKLTVTDPRLPPRTTAHAKPADGDVADLKERDTEFVRRMGEKIEKLLVGKSAIEKTAYVDELLDWHLRSSNYLENLQKTFPSQWEEIDSLIQITAASIRTEGMIDDSPPKKRLSSTRRDFAETLERDSSFMSADVREAVSWGCVAKWLGECPLDFPGAGDA